MFTGIVDHCATITAIQKTANSMRLTITHRFGILSLGESIAVDGVCLTVTHSDEHAFQCELSSETLTLTTAKYYQIGQRVNCERAMSPSGRFGGHMVTGHVDTTIQVANIISESEFFVYQFTGVDHSHLSLLTVKGSVAINGVSLTINTVDMNGFSVTLIPHTLSITNLIALKVGDKVNIEYDYLAKMVQRAVHLQENKVHSVSPVEQAIADIQQGKMVILVDDKDRENEGDLVVAAEKITPEHINFMAQFGRGLICMPMTADYFDRLDIQMMVQNNQCKHETGFGVSIGAASGITTGISAHDRAHTIRVAANVASSAKDIVKPGHVFPLKARDGGLLKREGHTEASTDLMRLAGLSTAAVICEIMNSDGTMARLPDLQTFAEQHQMTLLSIADLKRYRLATENSVVKVASAPLPTKYNANMMIHVYQNNLDHTEWVVVTSGDLAQNKTPLVRLHSACLTGDLFGSKRCDCGSQLEAAMEKIAIEGGALLYLPQEGRGIGLANKIKAYVLQDEGLDTVEANQQLGFAADHRDYSVAAKILQDLKITEVRLLTNNPDKVNALEKSQIAVRERVALCPAPTLENINYLKTKQIKLGHLLAMENV